MTNVEPEPPVGDETTRPPLSDAQLERLRANGTPQTVEAGR
jgi:hypothetical protein